MECDETYEWTTKTWVTITRGNTDRGSETTEAEWTSSTVRPAPAKKSYYKKKSYSSEGTGMNPSLRFLRFIQQKHISDKKFFSKKNRGGRGENKVIYWISENISLSINYEFLSDSLCTSKKQH